MAHFIFVKGYELLEHTADIGIRVKAADLKELFRQAAIAMFDIIAEERSKVNLRLIRGQAGKRSKKIIVKQKADNIEELFVNWLNELLSLFSAKYLIFHNFQINKICKNSLKAIVFGANAQDYKVNVEIKAATYHELKIEEDENGWQAQVIFDV